MIIDFVYKLSKFLLKNDLILIFVEKLNRIICINPTTKLITLNLVQLCLNVVFVIHELSKVLIIDRSYLFH